MSGPRCARPTCRSWRSRTNASGSARRRFASRSSTSRRLSGGWRTASARSSSIVVWLPTCTSGSFRSRTRAAASPTMSSRCAGSRTTGDCRRSCVMPVVAPDASTTSRICSRAFTPARRPEVTSIGLPHRPRWPTCGRRASRSCGRSPGRWSMPACASSSEQTRPDISRGVRSSSLIASRPGEAATVTETCSRMMSSA